MQGLSRAAGSLGGLRRRILRYSVKMPYSVQEGTRAIRRSNFNHSFECVIQKRFASIVFLNLWSRFIAPTLGTNVPFIMDASGKI